jgi:hypothetical protein
MPLPQPPRPVLFMLTAKLLSLSRIVTPPPANTHRSYSSRREQFALPHLQIIPQSPPTSPVSDHANSLYTMN